MSVRVVVGDPRGAVREKLLGALLPDPGIEVQVGVDDPVQTLELGREVNADVVVLGLPTDPSWLTCLSAAMSRPRVVAVMVDAPGRRGRWWRPRRRNRDSVDLVLDAVAAGVSGILALDGTSDAELRDAVMTVHRGGTAITPRFAERLLADWPRCGRRERSYGPSPLDEREREILRLLLQGRTPEEIARELKVGLSVLEEQTIPRVLWRAGYSRRWQPWRPNQRLPGLYDPRVE
jgi:hypothetical protein